MKKLSTLLACLILFASACAKKVEPTIIIVPDKCEINAGEEFPISLEGSNMPASVEITWSATKGVINPTTGLSVIYTAPQEPGSVIITALLETDDAKYSKTLTCEVTATAPSTEVVIPTTTVPTNPPDDGSIKIAITEVMSVPCNGINGPNKNEYLELFNYGNNDVDVNNWWIATGPGGEGTPDQITAWNNINPGINLGNHVVTNSSVIPPNGFAVIFSPRYYLGEGTHHMPYIFPNGTIILTLTNSYYLGNDNSGLLGTESPLSTLVLYIGSNSTMDNIISTYGTPTYGSSPNNVVDDHLDKFPYPVYNCQSVERVVPSGEDLAGNWRYIDQGNPGDGDY
jgi:hypothetical protein